MTKEALIKTLVLVFIFIIILVTFINTYKANQRHEKIMAESRAAEFAKKEFAKKMYGTTSPAASLDDAPVSSNKVHAPDDVGVSHAVSSLRRIMGRVENYLGKNGRWPETMTEIGYKPDTITNVALEAIKIDRGEIYGFLKPKYGNKKMIRIRPTLDRNPYDWECTTNIKLKGPTYLGGLTCKEDSGLSYTGTYFQ